MNRWHLLAIVIAVSAISLGISYLKGAPIDLASIGNSSLIAAILGGGILLFDWWGWRLPILYPWFVTVPCIRGKWDVEGDVSWVIPNQTESFKGEIEIKQTFFSIWSHIRWSDNAQMRFLMKAPIAAKEEGFCAFTAVYEFDPKKAGQTTNTRRAGFFFHASDRRPDSVTLHYSTTDGQVGMIRLNNRKKMSLWRWLMPS